MSTKTQRKKQLPAPTTRELIKQALSAHGKAMYSTEVAAMIGVDITRVCAALNDMYDARQVYRTRIPQVRNAAGDPGKGPVFMYYLRGMTKPMPVMNGQHLVIRETAEKVNGVNGIHRELEMNIKVKNGVATVTASADIRLDNGAEHITSLFTQLFAQTAAPNK